MSNGRTEYKDIIDHPHHVSSKRPQMSRLNRAAQFSPFAALTGYDSLVAESARITDQRAALSDEEYEVLNKRLNYLQGRLSEQPFVHVIYFEPDKKKSGGSYVEFSGRIKRVRQHEGMLLTTTGIKILFENIVELSGDFFSHLDSLEY